MSRALKAGLERYPVVLKGTQPTMFGDKPIDINMGKRIVFIDAYRQAEKDLGWHPVNESLPEIDEEVIVLTNEMNGHTLDTARHLCFAHRPNPNGWDGKNIITGEEEHFDVQTYDGWNIPGVRYWMPCPKIPEE